MDDRNQLVEQYYYLVGKVANSVHLKIPSAEMSDLLSSGAEGLIKASQTFNENHGVPFEAYARLRIHGAMIDELRRLDWVPRYQRDKQKKLDAYQQNMLSPVSFDVLIQDHIQDQTLPFEEAYEKKEEMVELVSAMSKLPEKEYQTLVLYYYEEFKMHEIAKILDVSESYVSRLISSAIKRLRGILNAQSRKKKVKA